LGGCDYFLKEKFCFFRLAKKIDRRECTGTYITSLQIYYSVQNEKQTNRQSLLKTWLVYALTVFKCAGVKVSSSIHYQIDLTWIQSLFLGFCRQPKNYRI
jgi:hypothetical protein